MSIQSQIRLLKNRRTKIVATLGPATSSDAMVERLIAAGVSMFRLNMSHGDHGGHAENYERIRRLAARAKLPIAILADLSGPKIRVGSFPAGPIRLEDGSRVTVTVRDVPGEPGLIPSGYPALASDVKPGDPILLADGLMSLRVESVKGTEVQCIVVQGGVLSDSKGVNLPGVAISSPSLTDKDREDATFALDLGVDYMALSFVRQASDITDLRELMDAHGKQAAIISKIEKPEALREISDIIEASDGVMVARGDLGVEVPLEEVPAIQGQIIDRCRKASRPVIVATQMLESMMSNRRPTRAEVTDVAHAVTSGADAIMLSGETAVGSYPEESVRVMDRISRHAEAFQWTQGFFDCLVPERPGAEEYGVPDAVARATAQLSRDLMVRGIVVASRTGKSTTEVASARPAAPVVALTEDERALHRMNILWGVLPMILGPGQFDRLVPTARRLVEEMGLAAQGQHILLVRGFSTVAEENAPEITVLTV